MIDFRDGQITVCFFPLLRHDVACAPSQYLRDNLCLYYALGNSNTALVRSTKISKFLSNKIQWQISLCETKVTFWAVQHIKPTYIFSLMCVLAHYFHTYVRTYFLPQWTHLPLSFYSLCCSDFYVQISLFSLLWVETSGANGCGRVRGGGGGTTRCQKRGSSLSHFLRHV